MNKVNAGLLRSIVGNCCLVEDRAQSICSYLALDIERDFISCYKSACGVSVFIKYAAENIIDEPIRTAVIGDDLFRMLKTIRDDVITLELKGDQMYVGKKVDNGTHIFKIPTSYSVLDDLPTININDNYKELFLPLGEFYDALEFSLACAGKNSEGEYVLDGILIRDFNSKIALMGTDSRRMGVIYINANVKDPICVFLPLATCKTISALLRNLDRNLTIRLLYLTEKDPVSFVIEDTIRYIDIRCCLVTGNYFKSFEKLINPGNYEIVMDDSFNAGLDLIFSCCDKSSKCVPVLFKFTPEKLTLRYNEKNKVSIETDISVGNDSTFSIAIDCYLLRNIIKFFGDKFLMKFDADPTNDAEQFEGNIVYLFKDNKIFMASAFVKDYKL